MKITIELFLFWAAANTYFVLCEPLDDFINNVIMNIIIENIFKIKFTSTYYSWIYNLI
jgi:hypothetical protein